DLRRRAGGRRQLLVRHVADCIDREPPQPRQVELDVVLGQSQLLEVCVNRLRRETLLTEIDDRRVSVALRELLSVRPEYEPVVDDDRKSSPERASDPRL